MPNVNYKISIIVPVYNKKDYLDECIESILSQTYGNLELLLVDDESTDGSGAICDKYADADGRVRVFHQKNGGPTAAVMCGMREAVGDYYTFIDSDDYVSKDMLQSMSECLVGKQGEIVCCNHVLEKRRETVPVIQPLPPGVYEGTKLNEEIKDKLMGQENRIIPMSRCMKLCEKSVFEGNDKYYDTRLRMGDDFNLMYPALLAAERIVIMEEALFYHYRYVEDSIVHGYDPNSASNVISWYEAILRIVRDRQVPDGEMKLNKEYCYMMLYVMKNELRNPARDYLQKIQDIFTKPEVRDKIVGTELSVRNKTNVLMYFGMRYPNKALLRILRVIVRWHDNSGKKGQD